MGFGLTTIGLSENLVHMNNCLSTWNLDYNIKLIRFVNILNGRLLEKIMIFFYIPYSLKISDLIFF